MKKILSLLNVLTISGTANSVSGITANTNLQTKKWMIKKFNAIIY